MNYSSAFSFCYAVGFLLFGPLSDRYGRKQIILFGLGVLTIVSPMIGLFDNLPWLITLRAIQGIAAATFGPAALAYVAETFPKEKRITTIGFVSTGFLMAGIVGQVISSLLTQKFGWNYVFYVLGGVYLITALLVAFFIPIEAVQQEKGNILSSFKQMGTVFTQKSLLLCYVITLTLLLTFVGMYTALGSYLSGPSGLSSQSILYVRCFGIVGMLISPFVGRLVSKYGIYTTLRSGLSLAIVGLAILGISSNLAFLIAMSVIVLDTDTLNILQDWKELQSTLCQTNFILSYNGVPTQKWTIAYAIQRYAKAAHVHRIKIHGLRHSHASLLISMGETPLVIKDRLGHKDIQTTLGTYGHLYPNSNFQVADKLSGFIHLQTSAETQIEHYSSNQFIQTQYQSVPKVCQTK